jgi:hypothetical protein
MTWFKHLVLAAACVLLMSRPAMPGDCAKTPKTVFQDKRGRVTGTARTYRDKTVFQDERGRVIGTARAYKGKTVFYDKQGRVVGRCVR